MEIFNQNSFEMMAFTKGTYEVSFARSDDDLCQAQELRALCFKLAGRDADEFDRFCAHILIRSTQDRRLVGCFRMLPVTGGSINTSYSAQFYDLSALAGFIGPMIELGRFCIHPNEQDLDIIRIAWAALTAYVDENKISLLFGCTSFSGNDTTEHQAVFRFLGARHTAPLHWAPKLKSNDVFDFKRNLNSSLDAKKAMSDMPPLLRTYLLMGGWVSDHAVFDRVLNTMHVFTAVDIKAIPQTRKRILRSLVG
jgi:putative hemolysin